LVAARIDRGTVGVAAMRIDALRRSLGIEAFVETSAKEGIGIPELRRMLKSLIDWDRLPAVSSNQLFQRIKLFILSEKKVGRVLSTEDMLFRMFSTQSKRKVERSEFDVSIGRLQSLGLVRRFSFGERVLLQPELLDAVASSIVSAARREPDGMGSIREDAVLAGKFFLPAEAQLKDKEKSRLLIVATTEDLIAHEIAFREPSPQGTLLVFPSQLTRENPELPDPVGKELEIKFEGPILNIYATLIVRLAHSGLFKLRELWKNAATFVPDDGKLCGLFLTEENEGKATITLFYDQNAKPESKIHFEDFISAHIQRMALPSSMQKHSTAICPNIECLTPVSTSAVLRRRQRGFDWMDCNVCGQRIQLTSPQSTAARTVAVLEMDKQADERKDIETALISASGEMVTSGFRKWAGGIKPQ
jgi:hypothetical protein